MREENPNPSEAAASAGPPEAAIAEVIRAKRDSAMFSDLPDDENWAVREAALLDDIASFDLEAAQQQAVTEAQTLARSSSLLNRAADYPEIVPEGTAAKLPAEAKEAEKKSAKAATRPGSGAKSAAGGLLAQLHAQAQTLQDLESAHFRDLTRKEKELGKVLYLVFSYLHDFSKQLDVIQPVISRRYQVADDHELRDLQWSNSFAEYRTFSHGGVLELAETVNLGYQLRSAAPPLVIEKEGGLAEAFRHRFFDFGLKVREIEFRSSSRYLERIRFIIKPEFRVGLHWNMDPIQNTLILRMRNLERLGPTRYFLKPEQVTEDLLERLGRLILGQSESFLH
ncbi:MAG: hypothetical protein LBO00_00950 [Zoogloeaceae bacterium]|jgi:hypothetical protein|nr:hypothetical protein [Zoogloeaceae bacterium]